MKYSNVDVIVDNHVRNEDLLSNIDIAYSLYPNIWFIDKSYQILISMETFVTHYFI
ncbi:hypothetical protein GCM10026987_19480 [Belliella aquatica]|uniref:Uncharacterized protein n=1 Tax=Belliella aquatica TaxID=1323734 RepID=A0ABQ1N201_9BACT|nr:hypothetical protein GCM10010993_32850 [Belliella aquatica]